jgi:hypothetical protein
VRADPGQQRVRVLLDPADDAATVAKLLARHDPPGGCVVVHPTPAAGGKGSLAYDLLAALGRPVTALEADGVGGVGPAWTAATAWMIADRIEHLVVLRAHRLPRATVQPLVELAATTGAALLLVIHDIDIPAQLRGPLGPLDVSHVQVDDAVAELDTARSAPPDRQVERKYPALPHHLPRGQIMHYRADVFRKHAGATFTRVDELYSRGLDTACCWLRTVVGPAPRQTWDAEPHLQALLTKLVHDSPSPQHTLALLRGAQTGFVLHGYWLTVPSLDALCGPGVTSRPVTSDVVERIRAGVAHPVLAAGVALAMLSGVSLLSLRSLGLKAFQPDDQAVVMPFDYNELSKAARLKLARVPGRAGVVFYVPTAAQPLMRAARQYMRQHSSRENTRMFYLFSPMIEAIEKAAKRCGLKLPNKTLHLDHAWQLRVRWSGLGQEAHAGPACPPPHPLTADPASAAPMIYRHPPDELGKRWAPVNIPHFLPDLLRAYLDGTAPTGRGFRDYLTVTPTFEPYDDERRRTGLVEQHLAVRVQPTGTEPAERIVMHPDLAFGLRLTGQPHPMTA